MKISLVSFAAEHFNNNGDQGNLEVLRFHLSKSGIELENLGQSQAETADFVLVGDCSKAALRFYKPGLDALVPALLARLQSGRPTLIVGASYEYLSEQLGLGQPTDVERISDFALCQEAGFTLVGYSNSATDLPMVQIRGSFIATKLFGPIFALNPELLRSVLKELGVELSMTEEMTENVEAIRRQISA